MLVNGFNNFQVLGFGKKNDKSVEEPIKRDSKRSKYHPTWLLEKNFLNMKAQTPVEDPSKPRLTEEQYEKLAGRRLDISELEEGVIYGPPKSRKYKRQPGIENPGWRA